MSFVISHCFFLSGYSWLLSGHGADHDNFLRLNAANFQGRNSVRLHLERALETPTDATDSLKISHGSFPTGVRCSASTHFDRYLDREAAYQNTEKDDSCAEPDIPW